MSNLVGTKARELQDLETIGFVASALFDVSAEKINRLRQAFEKNKAFYDEIASLYQSIKQSAFDRGELPQKSSNVVSKVSVAFTSNTRFYGSVNAEIVAAFAEHMKNAGDASDYLVIGRTGKMLLETSLTSTRTCSYYTFTEDEPTGEEIKQFLKHVAAYSQITMFYPSFINVFAHTVAVRDVTYSPREKHEVETAESFDYLFEPELPKILDFFETRVRYLLFKRAMLESELARTAARLFSMNQAEDRAHGEASRLRRIIRKEAANTSDLRLLESFSAISRWKK